MKSGTLVLVVRPIDRFGSRMDRHVLLESRCLLSWVASSEQECRVKLPPSCRQVEYI